MFVLSNQYLDTHCSSCAKVASASPFMRCSGCGTPRYCNTVSFPVLTAGHLVHREQSCQKADWNLHKPECSALQRWAKTAPSAALGVPNDAVRCLGRILWRMKSKGLDSGWVSPSYSWSSYIQSFIYLLSQRNCKKCILVSVPHCRFHFFLSWLTLVILTSRQSIPAAICLCRGSYSPGALGGQVPRFDRAF